MVPLMTLQEHRHYEPINEQGDWLTQEWFGINSETPIVWVKYEIRADESVWLWTIETKPEYRNQGYASRALKMLANRHHVSTIHHEGGYTPEGLAYISKLCTWMGYKWIPKKDGELPTANFRSMDFIKEWNIERKF